MPEMPDVRATTGERGNLGKPLKSKCMGIGRLASIRLTRPLDDGRVLAGEVADAAKIVCCYCLGFNERPADSQAAGPCPQERLGRRKIDAPVGISRIWGRGP
jgi:hypothetical protein